MAFTPNNGFKTVSDFLQIMQPQPISDDMIFTKKIDNKKIVCCDDRLAKAIKYVTNNIDEPISLKHIAGIACMTEQSFCRFFKKKTNKKFFEYLHELRMQHALQLLLQSSGNSICDIAYACGYNTSSHFCRIFKIYYGESPHRHRASINKIIA